MPGKGTVLDLAGVTEVDSAAVSLLLHWQRDAQATGSVVSLRNVPPSLLSLAKLYGVEALLPPVIDSVSANIGGGRG